MITGDIVNDGEEVQFLHARNYLYRLQNAGFTMRLIPGNHDYGKNGNWAKKENYEKFKEYFSIFHEIKYPNDEDSKPLKDHFFIGLNSMKAESKGLDKIFADGELGGKQIDKTVKFLKDHKDRPKEQKMIVYLHHHPFLFPDEGPLKKIGERVGHWLKDGKDFMEAITDQNVDILLFGHEHRHLKFEKTSLNKKYKIPYILSSGKSTEDSYEYTVLKDGTASIPVYKSKIPESALEENLEPYEFGDELLEEENKELSNLPNGLLERMIEIDDGGEITIETEIFKQKAG